MLILIDNYDSFTYNLLQFLGEIGAPCEVHRNDQMSVSQIARLKPEAIVLSPGPGTPNDAGICLDLVRELGAEVPILGVCLGHQSIGQVYGGKVVRARELMHGKMSEVRHGGAGIFEGLPSPFEATRYHSLILERETLPDCLEVTADTEDGTIMGIQHVRDPMHGVQFHPESIKSEHGHALLANFLKLAGVRTVEPVRRPVAAE